METATSAPERPRTTNWPRYDAMVTGLRNYWYPVAFASAVKRRPVSLRILDQRVMLLRRGGRLYALTDQCPHRGIPLSVGRQDFPGTWSCRYHGWVFDLETGTLKAALTDGPDSPICGKVRVKTYPVAERAGMVWIYMGDDPPPPVEDDIPREMLHPDAVVLGRITVQRGNWRYACENAVDEGHAKYLHRYGALATLFRDMPGWSTIKITLDDDGWLNRETLTMGYQEEYPGLGRWPRKPFYKRRTRGSRISMRLPGILRNDYLGRPEWKLAWYVPMGADRHRYVQFYVTHARGLDALKAHAYFWTNYRWVQLVQFNNQDAWMVRLMPETTPERLYRPDVSITAWRKLCEQARGLPDAPPPTRGAPPATDESGAPLWEVVATQAPALAGR
jgi:phenylpropionate dioxygenase-like ring-hydroxylating dioxygenase large terminal subunit